MWGTEPPRYGYVSNDNTVFISLDQFNGVNFNGQGWFLSKVPAWTAGKFTESFRELDQLSVGTSNQDLDTVKRVLENKPNESAEVFEFSGIKIPSEVVMRFGILLVIGVQVYFLTHLIELSKRLRASDPGWEVAWIGVRRAGRQSQTIRRQIIRIGVMHAFPSGMAGTRPGVAWEATCILSVFQIR